MVEGRRNGLHLDEEKRQQITKIKKRISELGVTFNKNLNEDTTHLYLEAGNLTGVPEDLVNSLEKDDAGRVKLTMKYPHFFPVTRKCSNPETRFLVEKTFQSACMEENTAILQEILTLRQEQAAILGYPSHAAYIQEVRMAKDPETVSRFLQELAVKLQPLWAKEKEVMLALKAEEAKELGFKDNGVIDYWDFRYLP